MQASLDRFVQAQGPVIERVMAELCAGCKTTLFANVTADNQVFVDALRKYFGGEHDPATLEKV